MPAHFERLLNLAKKSQSKLVVYDRFGGDHFVILPLDDFEQFFDSEISPLPKTPPSTPTATPTHIIEDDLRRVEVPVPSFFAPVEQPANDDEPLYYEEISEEEEGEEEPILPAPTESKESNQLPESVESEAEEPSTTPTPAPPVKSVVPTPTNHDWHRLGDVIRRVHPEIIPSDQPAPASIPFQEHPDDSDENMTPDDPVFLDEPVE